MQNAARRTLKGVEGKVTSAAGAESLPKMKYWWDSGGHQREAAYGDQTASMIECDDSLATVATIGKSRDLEVEAHTCYHQTKILQGRSQQDIMRSEKYQDRGDIDDTGIWPFPIYISAFFLEAPPRQHNSDLE
jgi:hypothetical protein